MPFSRPIITSSGEETKSLIIPKGTIITSPIRYMNRAEAFWGPRAREFEPERWLEKDGYPITAKEIQGHKHILTFSDGPRTCLGRSFALAEFKVRGLFYKNIHESVTLIFFLFSRLFSPS